MVSESVEGFLISDVIYSDAPVSLPEVCLADRAEPLLTSCVPNLHFGDFIVDLEGFYFEIDAYCIWHSVLELFRDEPEEHRCLACVTVSDEDNFK